MGERNHLIDFLRTIAAVWVVLFHLNIITTFQNNLYSYVAYKGYLGVSIFFVISGYCIYYAGHHAKTAGIFLIRRLFRIYPTYWFSLLVIVCCLVGFKMIHGANPVPLPKSFFGFLATVSLTTAPISSVKTINYVYWTLSYEVFFYIIVFFSLLLPRKFRLCWFVAISALPFFLPMHDQWVFFFIQCWPFFCLGLVSFRLLHCWNEYRWLNLSLLLITLLDFFFIHQPLINILTGCCCAILITINHFKPLKNNWISRLGDYSYSVYLIHVPIGVYLLGFIKRAGIMEKFVWLSIGWDIAVIGLIIFLSRLMFLHVELPAIQKGKFFSAKFLNQSRKASKASLPNI